MGRNRGGYLMVHLEYKSLVTNETINHYLSIIKNEKEKKDFMNIISKFDIRICTKPVIREEEFYYKIWILRRGTKKKAHIKQYYPLHMLKKFNSSIASNLTISKILDMIRINADVPDDFEEYCEIRFGDPSDEICRMDYLDDLRRAERFKKFITEQEIRAFPSINEEKNNNNSKPQYNEEKDILKIIDFDEETSLSLLGYSFIFLKDKKEYDKLADLQSTVEFMLKL